MLHFYELDVEDLDVRLRLRHSLATSPDIALDFLGNKSAQNTRVIRKAYRAPVPQS